MALYYFSIKILKNYVVEILSAPNLKQDHKPY